MSSALTSPSPSPSMPFERLPFRGVAAATWASILISLLSVAMLAWSYQVGRSLGMADSLSRISWARAHYSTAIAISRLKYGAPGYLILRRVWIESTRRGFVPDLANSARNPNQGIADALNLTFDYSDVGESFPIYMDDWGDDKGAADYYIIAYSLFGFQIQALYYLYFSVLAISLAAFLIQFWKDPGYLLFAPLYLAAHHVALLTMQDSLITSTVHDAHFLPVLGCLASLHVALLIVRAERNSLWAVPGLIVQTLVVLLVVDSRPSSVWLIYFPVGMFFLSLGYALWQRTGVLAVAKQTIRRSFIVLVLLAAPRLLGMYHTWAFDEVYTQKGVESHLIWHALYMGLSVHPDGLQHGLQYTDATSYLAGYKYLVDHPEYAAANDIDMRAVVFDRYNPQTWITDSVGYRAYDRLVREQYLKFFRENPGYVLASYLYYKPKYLIEQILWQAGLISEWPAWVQIELAHAPPTRHVIDLLGFPAVVVVLASVVLAYIGGGAKRLVSWPLLTFFLFMASLLPSIAVAPIYYEMQVVFGTVSLLLYAVGAAMLVPVIRFLAEAIRRRSLPVQPAQLRLAGSMAAALTLAVVTLQCRPMYAAASGAGVIPGRVPTEIVRDSGGQIWLLDFARHRHYFPDWETYLKYGGPPHFEDVREIDDEELRQIKYDEALAPTLSQNMDEHLDRISKAGYAWDDGLVEEEVTIPPGATNLAHGRPAEFVNGRPESAALVVDGNTMGQLTALSIGTTDSKQQRPWWQVDLGGVRSISYVQVWPRTDPRSECCVERLNNFFVFVAEQKLVSSEPRRARRQQGVTSEFVLGWAGRPSTIAINARGRYVRIYAARPGIMEIAEVQVWSR